MMPTKALELVAQMDQGCGKGIPQAVERFHNSRALSGIFKSGFFLRKKPLGNFGSGVRQL